MHQQPDSVHAEISSLSPMRVCISIWSPYACVCSGMLPGLVAGFYTFDECHIDLAQLSTFASARLTHAEAVGIDKQVQHSFNKTVAPAWMHTQSVSCHKICCSNPASCQNVWMISALFAADNCNSSVAAVATLLLL